MTQLEALVKILTALSILMGLLGLAVPAFLFFWGRKYFAEPKDTVSPLHMEERLRTYTQERDRLLEKLSFDIRQDMNNAVGRIEAGEISRHADLKDQVEAIRESMRSAFRVASEAKDQSVQAMHRAELTETRVTGVENVIGARLKHIEDMCESLSKRGNG